MSVFIDRLSAEYRAPTNTAGASVEYPEQVELKAAQAAQAPYGGARRYFERVRDWSTREYLGIHYKKAKPGGGEYWLGTPVRSVDEAILQLQYIKSRSDTRDVYAALGTQRETETRTTNDGKTFQIARRSTENAVDFKTLFMDLDVKPDAYASTEEALQALEDFCAHTGLPKSNMLVLSGTGGAHAYFVLDRGIPRERWQPMAAKLVAAAREFGLKFDAGCTTDAARILRVPDSWNYKNGEPLPVTMLPVDGPDIPVEEMEAALARFKATPPGKPRGTAPASKHKLGPGPISEKLKDAFEKLTPAQQAGGGGVRRRNIDEVAEHCPFIAQSLADGGIDNDNNLRLLTYKIATACEDTDSAVRRMVCNRATLEPGEVEEQLERAKREVEENPKLSWVTCEAVARAGAKACQGCDFRDKGLRPLTVRDAVIAQASAPPFADVALPDIPGGVYDPVDAMREISARFALVDRDGEVVIVHRGREGKDDTLSKGSFEDWLGNIYVRVPGEKGDKIVSAADWWRRNTERPPIRTAVFKPHGPIASNEYNFWRGFAVQRQSGTDKMRRLLRHMRAVICKRSKKKLKYLIRWLAWIVQNPDKNPETVVVLKSEREGSGKTTLSEVLGRIFGPHHAMKINSPMQLLGPHVDYLEYMCFVMIEEALFAGDPKTADQVKDLITGSTVHINPKGRKAYSAPNRASAIMTTNHDWAVPAGKDARRWFVCEVAETKVSNHDYFNALYADLEAGGYGQFLNFLLCVKLGSWHPRQLERTEELRDQQLLSAPPIKQWLRACAEDGEIPLWLNGLRATPLDLGKEHTTADLYEAYCGARKASGHGGRIEGRHAFGRVLKQILGEGARNHNVRKGDKYSPGYFIPDALTLAAAVEKDIIGGGDTDL